MRALIHVHHLLGTGHAVRAAALGRALAATGVDVVLVAGNRLPATLDTAGLSVATLPPAYAADASFRTLLQESGEPIDDAWRAERRRRLLALLPEASPDIILTETFPFGRRMLAFELEPLLVAARASTPRPLIAASVRDILVRKDDPAKEQAMAATARRLFDLVLVHADPRLVRLSDSFPFEAEITDLVRYTGFVHEPSPLVPPAGDGADEVIVSCGGGPVGAELLRAAISARRLSRHAGDARWRLLVGRSHDAATLAALAAEAGDGVIVETARPDFPGLLKRARLSVSQAGYNTVLDILAARVPAVLVPFAEGSETEQRQRAASLASRGVADVLDPEALTPERLAAACDRALAHPPAGLEADLAGAAHSAAILVDAAERRGRDGL
jgi:predicted glycosyltransferase